MGSRSGGRTATPLEPLVEKLEGADALDVPGRAVGKGVRTAVPKGPVKDALSGTWLGHAVHPVLTDVVVGSFLSATMLDIVGGDASGRARERLISIGIAAYGPTALTGVNDWGDSEATDDAVRRVGLVHATSNTAALSLYVASLAARRRGARRRVAVLGALGATMLSAASYLGGHLSFINGVGVDQTAFDPGPEEWTAVAEASQLVDGRPTRVVADETPVVLLRGGDRIYALHDRCSHRGCSLSEGEVDGERIVCACHGSSFDLRDGSIHRGPATAPQPAFEVREREDRIEVRRLTPRA